MLYDLFQTYCYALDDENRIKDEDGVNEEDLKNPFYFYFYSRFVMNMMFRFGIERATLELMSAIQGVTQAFLEHEGQFDKLKDIAEQERLSVETVVDLFLDPPKELLSNEKNNI